MTASPARTPLIGVVEDDDGTRIALARLLRAAGFQARTFDSAEAYLQDPQRWSFPCVVLDIHLGGMSGLDLARRLGTEDSSPKVIFITALDDDAIREEAQNVGLVAYLRKPFEEQLLFEAIRLAISTAT